jgi:hypothetical protein
MPLYVFDDDTPPRAAALPIGLRAVELITSPPEHTETGYNLTPLKCEIAKRDLERARLREEWLELESKKKGYKR